MELTGFFPGIPEMSLQMVSIIRHLINYHHKVGSLTGPSLCLRNLWKWFSQVLKIILQGILGYIKSIK